MRDDAGRQIGWRRYELKYLITEVQAAELAARCRRYLAHDEFSAAMPAGRYPTCSTYFDSPDRVLLRQTLEKRAHRFKLRIRTYRRPGEPLFGKPAFLEIKQKHVGVSHKFRACVSDDLADLLTAGQLRDFDWLERVAAAHRRNAEEFGLLVDSIGATAALGVSYWREAFEGDVGGNVRITIDRHVQYGLLADPEARRLESWWPALPGNAVILEVKFTNTYPYWLAGVLHQLELGRRGTSKYVVCSRAAARHAPAQRLMRVS